MSDDRGFNMGINLTDPDNYYRKLEKQYELDLDIHECIITRINGILGNSAGSYQEIGDIIGGSEYLRAADFFNDLKEFQTSYAVYSAEVNSGVYKTIYDIIDSINEYLSIRLSLLYLFRRIEFGHSEDDIKFAYDEIDDKELSPIFVLGMLKDLKVGGRGYVGRCVAQLLCESGREQAGCLLKSLVEKIFPDKESNVYIERDYYSPKIHNKKICFITCFNNQRMYEECLYYINKLIVPHGITIDSISISGADSMTSGYNAGMESSNADIKVYLHQDVCIINPYFITDLMDIFERDSNISMVGMVGSPKLPEDAVMWHGSRVGKIYQADKRIVYGSDPQSRYKAVDDVEAVDGLLIATNRDIRWRDDLFDGWDFYDVSEAAEHRKKRFKVVVPQQESPWVIHDDGIMNLYNYGKYRTLFINEYLS